MFYVGAILVPKIDGWFSVQNVIIYQIDRVYPHHGVELKLCLLVENVKILFKC